MKTKSIILIAGGLITSVVTVHIVTRAIQKRKEKEEEERLANMTPEERIQKEKAANPMNKPFIGNVAYAKGAEVNVRSSPEVNNKYFGPFLSNRWISNVVTLGTQDTTNKITTVPAGEKVGTIQGIETDEHDKNYRWFRVKNLEGIGGSEHKYGYVREDVVDITKPLS